jgi:hypothetical protein
VGHRLREQREAVGKDLLDDHLQGLLTRDASWTQFGRFALDSPLVSDEAYRRYVRINLPHARTILSRIGRSLEALGAFGEEGNGGALALHRAFDTMERELQPFDDDPPEAEALRAADALAGRGRELVDAIVETPARSDRLGQLVRNLFECLGLPEEGANLALRCGERADSPLR